MVTLFIDNLPKDMTRDWLQQIFKFEEFSNVFVSHKRRKLNHKPFGFVQYKHRREALKAIGNLNGLVIRARSKCH